MMNASNNGPAAARRLEASLERWTPVLRAISEADSLTRPAPGKWSPRELVGHLVDSASNNHQRFVRARFQDELVFPGYDQDAWVAAQAYQDVPWGELLALWHGFNAHLARVMAATPDEDALKTRTRHNLDKIAFRTVPASEPTTLGYFMHDYVDHLEHHLTSVAPHVT